MHTFPFERQFSNWNVLCSEFIEDILVLGQDLFDIADFDSQSIFDSEVSAKFVKELIAEEILVHDVIKMRFRYSGTSVVIFINGDKAHIRITFTNSLSLIRV